MSNKENIIFKPSGTDQDFQIVLDSDQDTVWVTEVQIAELFGRDRTVINRHINNSFEERELEEKSTNAFFALVQIEGTREVERSISHYNFNHFFSGGNYLLLYYN